jgi:hypothetical protein
MFLNPLFQLERQAKDTIILNACPGQHFHRIGNRSDGDRMMDETGVKKALASQSV